MSKVIWKYEAASPLDVEMLVHTKMGRIVHVELRPLTENRRQHVTLWIEHTEEETHAPDVTRRLLVVGTGHHFPDDATQLLTVLDGPFVWHLLEMGYRG